MFAFSMSFTVGAVAPNCPLDPPLALANGM